MISEQRPPVNNDLNFWFSVVVVVHRFVCTLISALRLHFYSKYDAVVNKPVLNQVYFICLFSNRIKKECTTPQTFNTTALAITPISKIAKDALNSSGVTFEFDSVHQLIYNPDFIWHHPWCICTLNLFIYLTIIAGVNFINVQRTNFSYECRFSSFFYVHVTRKKLPKWRLYKKRKRLMLMILTAGIQDRLETHAE